MVETQYERQLSERRVSLAIKGAARSGSCGCGPLVNEVELWCGPGSLEGLIQATEAFGAGHRGTCRQGAAPAAIRRAARRWAPAVEDARQRASQRPRGDGDLKSIYKSLLLVGGARWGCGQRARLSPSLRSKTGGTRPAPARLDCPHIHGYLGSGRGSGRGACQNPLVVQIIRLVPVRRSSTLDPFAVTRASRRVRRAHAPLELTMLFASSLSFFSLSSGGRFIAS
jgi:hypothetical protein